MSGRRILIWEAGRAAGLPLDVFRDLCFLLRVTGIRNFLGAEGYGAAPETLPGLGVFAEASARGSSLEAEPLWNFSWRCSPAAAGFTSGTLSAQENDPIKFSEALEFLSVMQA